jgi:hypothetical protein
MQEAVREVRVLPDVMGANLTWAVPQNISANRSAALVALSLSTGR